MVSFAIKNQGIRKKIHEINGWENIMFDDEFDSVKNPFKNSLSIY
jgi:hypothetical protein